MSTWVWTAALGAVRAKGVTNITRAILKDLNGVDLALFCAEVAKMCAMMGCLFSIENPFSSKLWSFWPIACLFRLRDVICVDIDLCEYGSPYKKSIRLVTNFAKLANLSPTCRRNHQHARLSGFVKSMMMTTAAIGFIPLSLVLLTHRPFAPPGRF